MLRIIFFFTSLLFLFTQVTNADANNCEQKKWFSLYTCRVNNVCEKYDTGVRMYNTEKEERGYLEWYNLYIAKNQYRNNMNNIYRCAMLKSQNNAYQIIQSDLNVSNPYSSTFDDRISAQRKNIGEKITKLDCLKTEKKAFQLKKDVLDEATLEMCKYLHFLDYIEETQVSNLYELIKDEEISQQVEEIYERDPISWKEEYLKLSEVDTYEFQNKSYTAGALLDLQRNARQELANEIRHTKKVYEVAYQTYSNYESNLIIHLLLNFLENDFVELRNSIYATLSPINQVVYKIANAMSF